MRDNATTQQRHSGNAVGKKTFVVISSSGQRVPFLRGILVQSLVAVGLGFEDAYATAQSVRDALGSVEEIGSGALRELVAERLQKRFGAALRRAYEVAPEQGGEITVRTPSRAGPFSVGILSRYLEGCAIARDQALEGARTVHEILRRQPASEVDSKALQRIVFETLQRKCCAEAADRFLSRRRFEQSGLPLIILVGGTSGTGKSTVTADLAYLLDIVRSQSTDMMREIIRCYLAPHVVPTLGFSSAEAWRGLPEVEPLLGGMVTENPVVAGFLYQFGTVKVALEATIARAVKERIDLIVDGVHVLPGKLDLDEAQKKAVVVPLMLAVTNVERLARQLRRRGHEQPERGDSRRSKHLEAIWNLQSYMLDQAEKDAIPVIANWRVRDTVRRILEEVMARIGERFPADPSVLE